MFADRQTDRQTCSSQYFAAYWRSGKHELFDACLPRAPWTERRRAVPWTPAWAVQHTPGLDPCSCRANRWCCTAPVNIEQRCINTETAYRLCLQNKATARRGVFFATSVRAEQGLTSHQTHYRSYRGRVLWVERPKQHCQSTEGRTSVREMTLKNKKARFFYLEKKRKNVRTVFENKLSEQSLIVQINNHALVWKWLKARSVWELNYQIWHLLF